MNLVAFAFLEIIDILFFFFFFFSRSKITQYFSSCLVAEIFIYSYLQYHCTNQSRQLKWANEGKRMKKKKKRCEKKKKIIIR